MRSQPYSLGFSAGQSFRFPVHRQVIQTDFQQENKPVRDFFDDIAVTSLGASHDVRVFTKIGALRKVMTQTGEVDGLRVAGFDVELDGADELVLMQNQAVGKFVIRSLATDTELVSWTAPSFGSTLGPFIAAW